MSDTHTMQIRIPKRLWERFQQVCKETDTTPSESIREYVRASVREASEHKSAMDHIDEELRTAFLGSDTSATAREINQNNRRNSRAIWLPDR